MNCSTTTASSKTATIICDRDCVKKGETIKLKMLFTDPCGNPVDPNSITLKLTDPDGATETYHVEDQAVGTYVDTGYYYYKTQALNIVGKWTEEWTADILGSDAVYTTSFEVVEGGAVASLPCCLTYNSLIVVEIDESITDTDGVSLEKTEYVSFSTEFNPFYISVDLLKIEMGPYVDGVPTDTLALAIHWSSLEADKITGKSPTGSMYEFARSRFVLYDAALRLFTMPMGMSGGSGKKQLGDLLIDNGLDFDLKSTISEIRKDRDEWWRVVNAGGCIVPGQGLSPTSAVMGTRLYDKISRSREWHNPLVEHYRQPTQNSLYRRRGETKYKHGFSGR